MHKRTTFFICWCWLDRDPGVRGRRRRLCCLESSRQLQNKQQREKKKNSFFPPWKKSSGFRQLWRVHSEAAGRAKATKKGGGGKRNKTTTHIRITCRWRKTIHDSHDSLSLTAQRNKQKKNNPRSLFYPISLFLSVHVMLAFVRYFLFLFFLNFISSSPLFSRLSSSSGPCFPLCTHTRILFVFFF